MIPAEISREKQTASSLILLPINKLAKQATFVLDISSKFQYVIYRNSFMAWLLRPKINLVTADVFARV